MNNRDKYKTNQVHIRIKYMFRGFIMANWYKTNFGQAKYIDLN